MTRKEALTELLEKVEAGEFDAHPPKFNAFCDCAEPALESLPAISRSLYNRGFAWAAYRGSLNSALRLHETVLPGWGWTLEYDDQAVVWSLEDNREVYSNWISASNPARAWLIAILKALIEGEG